MKSVQEINIAFKKAEESEMESLCLLYQEDQRAGVQNLIKAAKKRKADIQKEVERTKHMKRYEEKYSAFDYICGIDEVGRGPLAGPVVACAVILPKDCEILYINDSKKLSESKRNELYEKITAEAIAYGLGYVSPAVIDKINILQATYVAMREAINNLQVKPDILLNDAVTIPDVPYTQIPIIKGDAKSITIAAASIVAKVSRDRIMEEYDHIMPEYGFGHNKGYGSAMHIEALKKYGPSPIHRSSFIKNFCGEDNTEGAGK